MSNADSGSSQFGHLFVFITSSYYFVCYGCHYGICISSIFDGEISAVAGLAGEFGAVVELTDTGWV